MSIRIAARAPRAYSSLVLKPIAKGLLNKKLIRPLSTTLSKPVKSADTSKPAPKIKNPTLLIRRGFSTTPWLGSLKNLSKIGLEAPSFHTSNSSFLNELWRNRTKANPKSLELEKMENVNPLLINSLAAFIRDEGIDVQNISFPHEGLSKESLQNLFRALSRRLPILPAFGICNPRAMFSPLMGSSTPIPIYRTPSIEKLVLMEKSLKGTPSLVWGYQMQQIPLSEEYIDALSDHIMSLHRDNIIVATLTEKASTFIPPKKQ